MAATMNDDAGEPEINKLLGTIMSDAVRDGIAEGRLRFMLKWEMFVDENNEESAFRPQIVIEPAVPRAV